LKSFTLEDVLNLRKEEVIRGDGWGVWDLMRLWNIVFGQKLLLLKSGQA
jgi:hypothetical protein